MNFKGLHNISLQGRKELEKVNDELLDIEKDYDIGSRDDSSEFDRLNFGLLEVVYEWASNKVLL